MADGVADISEVLDELAAQVEQMKKDQAACMRKACFWRPWAW
jgi:hypothetical protein